VNPPVPPRLDVEEGTRILARTPAVLRALLTDLPGRLVDGDEGPETFSPLDVVGHLVHGERADWITRAKIILSEGEARAFDPFDRFAMYEESRGKSLDVLLDEFERLRVENLDTLHGLLADDPPLEALGTHPELGRVTLGELLATWVVHDLSHLGQIARVIARQYYALVGPWRAYLPILSASAARTAASSDST